HSLKSFPLPDGRIALADVAVTGLRDESGRGGIRKAGVDIMQTGGYLDTLRTRLQSYPQKVKLETSRKPRFGHRRMTKIQGDSQVVVSHLYTTADNWQMIEALILAEAIELLDRRWLGSKYFSFTTLALEYRDESQVVVLPESRANELQAANRKLH